MSLKTVVLRNQLNRIEHLSTLHPVQYVQGELLRLMFTPRYSEINTIKVGTGYTDMLILMSPNIPVQLVWFDSPCHMNIEN